MMEVASGEYGDFTHKMVTAVKNSNTMVMKTKAAVNGG